MRPGEVGPPQRMVMRWAREDLNLPNGRSTPPIPVDEWRRTIQDLHEQLINGREGTLLDVSMGQRAHQESIQSRGGSPFGRSFDAAHDPVLVDGDLELDQERGSLFGHADA